MTPNKREVPRPSQVSLMSDIDPPIDLSKLPNDADDKSDKDRPTTDHEAEGWRATPPAKP